MPRRLLLIAMLVLIGPARAQPTPALSRVEQARKLIESGRGERALPLVPGDLTIESIVRAEALFDIDRYVEVDPLLEKLFDQRAPEVLAPPYDFRRELLRGRYHQLHQRFDLAERFYAGALRLAGTPDQKLEALDRLISLQDRRELWDKANARLEQTLPLIPQVSPYAMARHLMVVGRLQQDEGRRAEAMSTLAGARATFESLGLPVLTAEAQLAMAVALAHDSDLTNAWTLTDAALTGHLQAESPERALDDMTTLFQIGLQLAPQRANTLVRLSAAADAMPAGPYRSAARLRSIKYNFLLNEDGPEMTAQLASLDRETLSLDSQLDLLRFRSELAGQAGRTEEALAAVDQALALAIPRLNRDQLSYLSRGPLLLDRAEILREQKQYEAALRTVHEAIAAQPTDDWAYWRVDEARHEGLLITLAVYDEAAARVELEAGLETARGLDTVGRRATAVTRMLAALSLNQSLDQDLLDPGERIFGGYDPVARSLLSAVLAPDGALNSYLAIYDAWLAQSTQQANAFDVASALLYKSVFLDAALRAPEARAAAAEALAVADAKGLDQLTLLARLLLARLDHFAGRGEAVLATLTETVQASRHQRTSTSRFYLLLLGSYQLRMGQPAAALVTYEASIEAWPEKAWAGLYGKALALEKQGKSALALASIEGALGFPEMASRAVARSRMLAVRARLLQATGRAPEALKSLAEAFPTVLELGNPDTLVPLTLEYSKALLESGDLAAALTKARQALDALTERGTASQGLLGPLFERVANLSLQAGENDQALRYLELSHSAELVSSVKLSAIEHDDPATRSVLGELDALKQRLEGLQREASLTEAGPKRQGLGKVLAETREEFFAKMDQLKRTEPDFESLVQLSGSSLSAIQSSLDEGTALLEFYPSEETLYLFVVTKDNLSLHQVLIGRSKLSATVAGYVALVRDPDSDQKKLSQASHLLQSLLLEPALAEIGTRKRLLLVPSGPLWLVPFEELRDAKDRALDQRYEVSMLTSADLLRTLSTRRVQGASKSVLLGAPDAEDLPGASAELDELAKELPSATLLKGTNATSEALRKSARDAQILHIASHSGAGGQKGQCYISLADGPFSLEKIYGLDLGRGALVVLSSCRSALGESEPGREVTSLASAFNVAGASTVIASHWEVDDEVTRRLFVHFYKFLEAGHSRGEALRLARLEVAKSHPHPYYWAAFSLFGSPD